MLGSHFAQCHRRKSIWILSLITGETFVTRMVSWWMLRLALPTLAHYKTSLSGFSSRFCVALT